MFERLDRYRSELENAKQRRAEIDARIRTLEKKCEEAEKTSVHELMKEENLTPEELAALIALAKKQVPRKDGMQAIKNDKESESEYEE